MRDSSVYNNSQPISDASADVLQPEKSRRTKVDTISAEIITDLSSFKNLETEWDNLLEKTEGTIYSSFNWIFGWWKHFGENAFRTLSIVVLRKNGRVICIAPLYIGETRILNFSLQKRLRLMGDGASIYGSWGYRDTYGRSDFLDILCDVDAEDEVVKPLFEAIQQLVNDNRIDHLNFEHINDRSFVKRKLYPLLDTNKELTSTIRETDVCPTIHLNNDFDAYLMELSSSSRRKLRTSLKAETKKDGYEVSEVTDPEEVDNEIDILIQMHQSRWNDLGYPGAFFDTRFEHFIKEFAQIAQKKGQLWFKIAKDKKGHCATRLAFKYKGRYYDYLTSFDYDSPSSKYRPGIGLLTHMIKDAFENDGRTVELLRGDEAYKFDLTSDVHKNWSWKVSFNKERNKLLTILTDTVSLLTFTVLKEATLFQVQKNLHNSLKALVEYPRVRYEILKYKYQDD